MNRRTRYTVVFYLALVMIGMVLLSASLPDLQFRPGLPFPGAESSTMEIEGETPPVTQLEEVGSAWQSLLALAFTATLIVLTISLVKNVNIKRIAGLAGVLVVIVAAAIILNQVQFTSQHGPAVGSPGVTVYPSFSYETAPIGDPPDQLLRTVSILLSLGIGYSALWMVYRIFRKRMEPDLIALEAGAALKAINDGDNLKNVILRCYIQMERVARVKQGIERDASVTPREFEVLLTAKGIPISPVHNLTALFEKARYGAKALDLRDEQAAVDCLQAIRSACESSTEQKRK